LKLCAARHSAQNRARDNLRVFIGGVLMLCK